MLIWDTCPKYAQARNAILQLPELQNLQNENKQLYEELTNLTGMTIASPDDVSSLYSTLKAEVRERINIINCRYVTVSFNVKYKNYQ